MNILLVYPTRLNKSGAPVKYWKAFIPPLQLAVLDALTPAKHKVTVINDIVEDIPFSDSFDLVGITSMTTQSERAYQIADRFRELGVKVVIGGVHATFMYEEAKTHADSVVIGEAEDIWEQVLADCQDNRLRDFYKADSLTDLKRLVIPKWDNMNLNIYQKPKTAKMPAMPIYTTRGCPFKCKFCSVTHVFGHKFRVKPIENVLKEIEYINAPSYYFADDNIVGNPDYARELLNAIIQRKNKLSWYGSASTTILKSPDLIDLAAQAGCDDIFLGIETINPVNLKSVNKHFNAIEEYKELFTRFRKAKIESDAGIILGFDDDTPETFRETVDFLIKLRVPNAVFFVLTPLPGTPLFKEFEDSGRLLHKKWSGYDFSTPVFRHDNFTEDTLSESYWRTWQEFYSIPNIVRRTAQNITSCRSPILHHMRGFLATQLYFRSLSLAHEHPYSGGVGRPRECRPDSRM